MATVELKVKVRKDLGKESVKKVRRQGLFPAVLYGEGEQPLPLVVNCKEFYPVIHTQARENVILDLAIEGASRGECKAIIREIQYHPVRREILHVDFQHISMTKEISVRVPVTIVGESVGVKSHGGILEHITREVEVLCLPANIPNEFKIDVSGLDIGDSLQVKDLVVEGVKLVSDPDLTVVTIVAPTVVEEVKVEAAPEAVEAVPGEEPEEKKEEEPKAEAEK